MRRIVTGEKDIARLMATQHDYMDAHAPSSFLMLLVPVRKIIDDSLSLATHLATSEGTYVASIFLISNFALLGVLYMGANMVVDGALSVGSLASFCLYAQVCGDTSCGRQRWCHCASRVFFWPMFPMGLLASV